MNLYKARKLVETLSERYLYAKQIQFAGFDDEDDMADEQVAEIFTSIIGMGVGLKSADNYFIRFYHDGPVANTHLIAEECKVEENELVFEFSEPFYIQVDILGIISRVLSGRKRPATIGCSVGRRRSNEFGSVGCFVKDAEGQKYLLSNRHVLFSETTKYEDNFIVQPATAHGGIDKDVIGVYRSSLPFSRDEINEFDAALAGPLSCEVSHEIPGSDPENKRMISGYAGPDNNMQVYKCGVSSHVTYGVIDDISVAVGVNYNGKNVFFKNLVRVKGFDDKFEQRKAFSEAGDSGSVLINLASDEIVGLLFAGSGTNTSLACPIDEIIRQFGVSLI